MVRTRPLAIAIALAAALAAAVVGAGCRCTPGGGPPGGDGGPSATWPLTGEAAPDGAAIRQRVMSVKIENLPAARPQDGLDQADVVYETLTEGGITRFNALFHSRLPDRAGPVRSARFSDIYIVRQYDALLAYSGANSDVLAALDEAGVSDAGVNAFPQPYGRVPERAAPHNLYLDVAALRQEAVSERFAAEADPPELLFGDAPAAEASGTAVTIPFRPQNRVTWSWDEGSGEYRRAIQDEPHVDEGAESAYGAANVVVLYAERVEAEKPGRADILLVGSGDAIVFRDGKRYDAAWSADESSPPRFTTSEGVELPLARGTTWIEVVPPEVRAESG